MIILRVRACIVVAPTEKGEHHIKDVLGDEANILPERLAFPVFLSRCFFLMGTTLVTFLSHFCTRERSWQPVMRSTLVKTTLSIACRVEFVPRTAASSETFNGALTRFQPGFPETSSKASRKTPSQSASMAAWLIIWVFLSPWKNLESICFCSFLFILPSLPT